MAPNVAIDRAGGRFWHMAAICAPTYTRVVLEWVAAVNGSEAPSYVSSCAFDAAASQQGDVRIFSHDGAVFADGPYYVRPSDASIVGLSVPPPKAGAPPSHDMAALATCGTTVVASIPPAFVSEPLLVDDGGKPPLTPLALYLSPPLYNGSGLTTNATAISLVTGAVMWTSTMGIDNPGGHMAEELHPIIARRQLIVSSECFNGGRFPVSCGAFGIVDATGGAAFSPFVPTTWANAASSIFSSMWTDGPPTAVGSSLGWPAHRVDLGGRLGPCRSSADLLEATVTTAANASLAATANTVVYPGACWAPPPPGGASACVYSSFALLHGSGTIEGGRARRL